MNIYSNTTIKNDITVKGELKMFPTFRLEIVACARGWIWIANCERWYIVGRECFAGMEITIG